MSNIAPIFRLSGVPDNNVSTWEQQVEALPNIQRLSLSDHAKLAAILQLTPDVDSYLTSPTYYFFTGRHGLWHYSSNFGDVFFCWHPNRAGHVLIFPPVSKDEQLAILDVLQILPPPPSGLSLIRIKDGGQTEVISQMLQSSKRSLGFNIVQETVLDWLYPIRILSTPLVTQSAGNCFRNVRKGLIHMRSHIVRKEKLNFNVHMQDVRALLHQWASISSNTKEEYAELYETYAGLFSLSLDVVRSIEGLVYYVDGNIEAISLWDISGGEQKTANLYANFCNTNINGLAEYTIVSVSELLSGRGIDLLNLGGSEIQSLDFFKCKFRPAISIKLLSIDIKLGELSETLESNHSEKAACYA